MKTWIFTGILSALFVIALCAAASAQCPGGTCQRPAKASTKTTAKVVTKAATSLRVRKAERIRLFRRWR